MSTKRSWLIILLASAIMLACAIGLQSNSSAQAAVPQAGVTIPYSGRLSDASGLPVSDGAYDFTFALYDTAAGGAPSWAETQTGVAVQAGSFTAQLGRTALLPASARDGQKWLAVSVRGPGEAQFTELNPRQALSTLIALAPASPAAPAAGPSCAHDHLGEAWGAGGTYSSIGNALSILNSGTGAGLRVEASTTGYSQAAITALNTGTGSGLNAESTGGAGVVAHSFLSNGAALDAWGTYALKARGAILTDSNFTVYLSPYTMIVRSPSTGMTLIPQASGAITIRNDSGTGEKYVALPVSTFGMLFGSPLYITKMDVCYKVNTAASGKIAATGVFKNDGADSWLAYNAHLNDGTERASTIRECFTLFSWTPHTMIDNSSWVQFNLNFGGTGATSDITIYSVKLTLGELANPNSGW